MSMILTIASIGATVVLALWVMATVFKLDDECEEFMKNYVGSAVLFVPNWNFFSPHPGQFDYILLYRDKLEDGAVTH